MEVVPTASAARHAQTVAASPHGLLTRRRSLFANGVLVSTLVLSAYGSAKQFQSMINFSRIFSSSATEDTADLPDHPLAELATLLRFFARTLIWASYQLGWVRRDSKILLWYQFFRFNWLGVFIARQIFFTVAFSAIAFFWSRLGLWFLQLPTRIFSMGYPWKSSLQRSNVDRGLEQIAAELHAMNTVIRGHHPASPTVVAPSTPWYRHTSIEVLFRPAFLVCRIVFALTDLLDALAQIVGDLALWPIHLAGTICWILWATALAPVQLVFWLARGRGATLSVPAPTTAWQPLAGADSRPVLPETTRPAYPAQATPGDNGGQLAASHPVTAVVPAAPVMLASAPIPVPQLDATSAISSLALTTLPVHVRNPAVSTTLNVVNINLTPADFASRSRLVSVVAPQIRLSEVFDGPQVYESLRSAASSDVWEEYQNYLNCRETVTHFAKPNSFLRWLLSWNIDGDQLTRLIEQQKAQALALTQVATSYSEVVAVLRQLDQLPFLHYRFQEVFWELTLRGALSHPDVAVVLQRVFERHPHYFSFFAKLDANWWALSPNLPGKPAADPKLAHYIRNGRQGPRKRRGPARRRSAGQPQTAAAALSTLATSISTPSSYFSTVVINPNGVKSTVFWDLGAADSFISPALLSSLTEAPRHEEHSDPIFLIGQGPRALPPQRVTVTFDIPGLAGSFTFGFRVFDSLVAPLVLGSNFWATYRVVLAAGEYFHLNGCPIPTLAPSEITLPSDAAPMGSAVCIFDTSNHSTTEPLFAAMPEEFLSMLEPFRSSSPTLALPPIRAEDYRISIKPSVRRAKNRPLPQYSLAANEFLASEVSRLLDAGLIEPSYEPDFVVPQLVPKKTGSYRIVFDFRPVNEITEPMPTSLASFRTLMPGLAGAAKFTSLDLQSGYHQLRIHDDTKPYTTFNTPFGKYQWRVLPFGLCDAPQVFGSYMTELLRDHTDYCRVYLDDILIFSPDSETHLRHVRTILQVLADAHHQVNWDKCEFHADSLEWVGHQISAAGIAPTDTFRGQVQNLGVPRDKSDIKAFLGHVGYLQEMIPNFSHRTQPLTDLLTLHARFDWSDACQKAFEDLKNAVLEIFPVQSFDPTAPIQIHTDASDYAASAVLLQPSRHNPEKWLPVEYRSRKFDKHQRNWDIHLKEFWAVKFACQKFRFYLENRFFTLYSDQKSISQIFARHEHPARTSEPLDPRLQRWMLSVLHYRFRVLFHPGQQNLLADHLSRNPALAPRAPLTAGAVLNLTADGSWQRTLAGAYNTDPYFAPIYAEHEEGPSTDDDGAFKIDSSNGFLYYKDRLCIPQAALPDFLQQTHSSPTAGHPGIRRWLLALRARYFFPDMMNVVTNYVSGCDICQRVKYNATKPAGLLQPSTPPLGRWTDIATDLITGLPPVTVRGQELDAVLTIVCKFSNRSHFYAVLSKFSTQDFVNLFFERYFPLHGLPLSIQSDRGPQFTSAAFQSLMRLLKIDSRLSIARHQQSDGRVENRNKLIETYLRLHVEKNTDWPLFLPIGEFVLNSQVSTSLGKSPFEVDLLYQPLAPSTFMFPTVNAEASRQATDITDRMDRLHTSALASHQAAFESAKTYYDRRHADAQLAEGEEVYVDCSDLQHSPDAHNVDLPRKLRTKFSGPYTITEVLTPVNYRLAMPSNFRGNDVFHIRLLRLKKTVPEHYFTPANSEVPLKKYKDGSVLVEVTEILGHMKKGRGFKLVARLKPSAEFPQGEIHEFRAKDLATTAPDLVAAYARRFKLARVLAYIPADHQGSVSEPHVPRA